MSGRLFAQRSHVFEKTEERGRHHRNVDTSQHPVSYHDPLVTVIAGLLVVLAASAVVFGVQALSSHPVASHGAVASQPRVPVVTRAPVVVAPVQRPALDRGRVHVVRHRVVAHRLVVHRSVVLSHSTHRHHVRHRRHSHGHHERHRCGHHGHR